MHPRRPTPCQRPVRGVWQALAAGFALALAGALHAMAPALPNQPHRPHQPRRIAAGLAGAEQLGGAEARAALRQMFVQQGRLCTAERNLARIHGELARLQGWATELQERITRHEAAEAILNAPTPGAPGARRRALGRLAQSRAGARRAEARRDLDATLSRRLREVRDRIEDLGRALERAQGRRSHAAADLRSATAAWLRWLG